MHTTSKKREEERSVTFVFRQGGWQHCAGINSVVVSSDERHLWTASRDSLIKRWDISSAAQPTLETDFQGHIDWVNAIALLGDDTLISCSSDKTVRIWKASGDGTSEACMCGHSDYVTSLAAPTSSHRVASGGLGGEVFLWDLNAQAATSALSVQGQSAAGVKVDGARGSIYSLACDASGAIVAAGTSAGGILIIDARSGRAEAELRGHASNVRALCMRPDAGTLVSGSSDHTMRVWDLRQRRAGQALAVHTDSVWALAPVDASLSAVMSGGRDGRVYCTNLSSRVAHVLAEEIGPVTALGVGSKGTSLWVGTADSTVKCWRIEAEPSTALPGTAGGSRAPGSFTVGSLPAMRTRTTFENGALHPHAPQDVPLSIIPGSPAVRQVAVLTDKRHVLTQDSADEVVLWDLSVGSPVRTLGKVSLKDAERELFDPAHNVAPWFRIDTRLGCLAGTLEPPACFAAEAYRRDLGEAEASADAKINMAEHMLKALFAHWVERRAAGPGERTATPLIAAPLTPPPPPMLSSDDAVDADGDRLMQDASDSKESKNEDLQKSSSPGLKKAFDLRGQVSPVIMVSGGNGFPPWRVSVDSLDGRELEGEAVPQWVADCVLRGKYPTASNLKMSFTLSPAQGSGLPALLQSKLTAPRVLSVDKVADYVLRKMADQGFNLREEPLFWSAEKQALWQVEHGSVGGKGAEALGVKSGESPRDTQGGPRSEGGEDTEPSSGNASGGSLLGFGIRQLRPVSLPPLPTQTADRPLLITCAGATVPWDFTLAAVRQWMWKRPEDLKLEYGIRKPGIELRPPVIRPPI